MREQRPTSLDYQRRPPPGEDAGRPAKRFFLGLVLGSMASATWVVGWNQKWMGVALLLIPFAKIIAAVVFTAKRSWRPLGAGLLVSIGVGALIFFFTCAANFKI